MVFSTEGRAPAIGRQDLDILVAALGVRLAALSWSLRMKRTLGRPELVLVTDDGSDAAVASLREIRLEPILERSHAVPWIIQAAPLLAAVARARRTIEAATANLPALPAPEASVTQAGLFRAEQRFRESYIRALIGRTRSHREAAAQAGVSYRTFCHIVKKLGLSARQLESETGMTGAGHPRPRGHREASLREILPAGSSPSEPSPRPALGLGSPSFGGSSSNSRPPSGTRY